MDGSSSSFKVRAAGETLRAHDTRHTFISLLTENANVSEQTIGALTGMSVRSALERLLIGLLSQFCRRPGTMND